MLFITKCTNHASTGILAGWQIWDRALTIPELWSAPCCYEAFQFLRWAEAPFTVYIYCIPIIESG